MKLLSIEPIVPSGKDFEQSKQFFQELGFILTWGDNNYADFEWDGCKFTLQRFDKPDFASNYMLIVRISDAASFRNDVIGKKLPEKFGIHISVVTEKPYGKEVNIIDIAGVCWHFVE